MSVIRGKGRGLELNFAERPFEEALAELRSQLDDRGEFYRGSPATAVFAAEPAEDQLARLLPLLSEAGIRLEGTTVREAGVAHKGRRHQREVRLSEAARSLVADFAGARADLAQRRVAKETIAQFTPTVSSRVEQRSIVGPPVASLSAVPVQPDTLYHQGTVRGGQSLHHLGNLVVMGDVNPGSELVASGDIVVFGALRGVAHAGAQGDERARVYALELAATQLRIATFIAADSGEARTRPHGAEVAVVNEGRIHILPYEQAAQFEVREGVH